MTTPDPWTAYTDANERARDSYATQPTTGCQAWRSSPTGPVPCPNLAVVGGELCGGCQTHREKAE